MILHAAAVGFVAAAAVVVAVVATAVAQRVAIKFDSELEPLVAVGSEVAVLLSLSYPENTTKC